MKNLFKILPIICLTLFASCEKSNTDEITSEEEEIITSREDYEQQLIDYINGKRPEWEGAKPEKNDIAYQAALETANIMAKVEGYPPTEFRENIKDWALGETKGEFMHHIAYTYNMDYADFNGERELSTFSLDHQRKFSSFLYNYIGVSVLQKDRVLYISIVLIQMPFEPITP